MKRIRCMYIPLARVELHTNTHIASAKLYTCLEIRAFMMADSFMYRNNRALSSTSSGICIAIDNVSSGSPQHGHRSFSAPWCRQLCPTGSHRPQGATQKVVLTLMQCNASHVLISRAQSTYPPKAQLWRHLCLAPSFFVYTHSGCRQCRLFQWLSLETR